MLSAPQVEWVLTAASTAPSLYGSKPWMLRCRAGLIELHADLTRSLDSADPDQRQLWLACGAVLLNLRLAIRALGMTVSVHLMTDPDSPKFIATVNPHELSPATAADLALADVMLSSPDGAAAGRAGDPGFLTLPVTEPTRNLLRRAARSEQGWLASISPAQLPALRVLARQARRAQDANPAFVAEWDRRTDEGRPVPGSAPARNVESDRGPGDLVAVIGTFLDIPAARLQAGQAMQRVLLAGSGLGLSPAFSPELVEVPAVRTQLRAMIGGGVWPQTVLRLGYRANPDQ